MQTCFLSLLNGSTVACFLISLNSLSLLQMFVLGHRASNTPFNVIRWTEPAKLSLFSSSAFTTPDGGVIQRVTSVEPGQCTVQQGSDGHSSAPPVAMHRASLAG